MTATVGTSTNTNTAAILSDAIPLNGMTSTTILAAQAPGDTPRIKVIIQNSGATGAWIKFQAASVDDDKKGVRIPRELFLTVLSGSDIYTGEISAIADAGNPSVYVTWF